MRRSLRNPDDGAFPTVKNGRVFGNCYLVRGGIQRPEIRVVGAAIGVTQLSPRHREVSAHLDQRQHSALQPRYALQGRRSQWADAPQVRRRLLPAQWTGEVDNLAGRESWCEPLTCFLVYQLPAGFADRRLCAQQMIHCERLRITGQTTWINLSLQDETEWRLLTDGPS
jgi:hypothetical protein